MSKLFLSSTPVKNIVFDFGGVLLDLDFSLTYDRMSHLLGFDFYPEKLSENIIALLHNFETGKISKENFLWNIQILSQNKVPQGKEIINAWNAMLLGWNPDRFDFLQVLRRHYNVFLLSNTNEIHIDWVRRDLKNIHNIHRFEDVFFDKVYYSHEIKMRKPSREIFEYLAEDAQINPLESLFVDDLIENVEAALSVGFQGYHHNPTESIVKNMTDILKIHGSIQ